MFTYINTNLIKEVQKKILENFSIKHHTCLRKTFFILS